MWRVVCMGPGPQANVRRVVDRGPLLPEEARARHWAAFLAATGFYERVTVEYCADVTGRRDTPAGTGLSFVT